MENLNRKLYLDLMKISLLDLTNQPLTHRINEGTESYPGNAKTMIGYKRLENIQSCFETIIEENVEGSLIETGVWRGGATIFMAALVKSFNEERKVFVADSFDGLPMPNPTDFPADFGDKHYTYDDLKVSFEEVLNNFKSYDLMDPNVIFLKGWFKDTLPGVKDEKFCLVRLDGDMYESTWQSLEILYPNLSVGGYLIVDDWLLPGARKAVEDYRIQFKIDEPVQHINEHSVFWKK